MAQYPIKMLKDENGTPFVPLVAPEAVKDNQGTDWQALIDKKLEKTNIIAGDNITLSVSGNDITINSQADGASDYTALSNKPSLDTTSDVSLNPLKEEINGEISLHKIAKTGNYEDLLYKPIIPITFPDSRESDYLASELPSWQVRLLQRMIDEYRYDNNSINNYILRIDGLSYLEDTSGEWGNEYSNQGKNNRLYTFKKSGPIGNIPHAFQFVGPTSLSYDNNPKYENYTIRFDNNGILICCDNNYVIYRIEQRYDLYDEGKSYAQINIPRTNFYFDGTNVFGKYASAASGENLTENYGVTSRDIEKLRIGTKWRWRSSVQPRANNIGIIYYTNTYSALIPGGHGREYSVVNVSMNGNYYQYAYD